MPMPCHRQPIIPTHRDEQACVWPSLCKRWPVAMPRTRSFADLECEANNAARERALRQEEIAC